LIGLAPGRSTTATLARAAAMRLQANDDDRARAAAG
jgi:hypothetical protein